MRRSSGYGGIAIMTGVAIAATYYFYSKTAAEQRGDLLSFIAVIIAICTLAATIFIALYIYNKGKQDEENEEKKQQDIAKALMGSVVVEAIRWLITDVAERPVGVANR